MRGEYRASSRTYAQTRHLRPPLPDSEAGSEGARSCQVDGGGDTEGRRVQAAAYEAFFQATWDLPWVAGAYWWKWFPQHERSGGDGDDGFTPQNKPAQKIMADWYLRTHLAETLDSEQMLHGE